MYIYKYLIIFIDFLHKTFNEEILVKTQYL